MNIPPADGIRVPVEELRQLVAGIYQRVPIPADHARLIADLLIDTELRGVVSHGVVQVERYVRGFQQGRTNPQPAIRVLREGPGTAALCGDGGLGMIVATRAMHMAMAKARAIGVGVATSTYHDHLGSSGKYVRMALREGMIGISLSGRSAAREYDVDSSVHGSIQGSPPLAFGMPAGAGHPPFLLDMASHFPWDEECFRRMPQVFLKAFGLSHVANILSGTLGGQMLPEFDRHRVPYAGADQSGFFVALDVERFVPHGAFTQDVDRLVDGVSGMRPFPGTAEATLPGGRAWRCEQDYLVNGIPISTAAVESLEVLGREFGLAVPWRGM